MNSFVAISKDSREFTNVLATERSQKETLLWSCSYFLGYNKKFKRENLKELIEIYTGPLLVSLSSSLDEESYR